MHYELEMNQHAMSEDASDSIKGQVSELWDYMFPLTKGYARNAKEQLQSVKDKYGID